MPFTIVATQAFAFADGNGGHVCQFSAGSPSANDHDLLFVSSDTLVTTPAGFTVGPSRVNNQAAYAYRRKSAAGAEGDSVTITTSGNFPTRVIWVRLRGANAADVTGSAGADGALGTSTPSFTSGTLAESTEIAFAFLALHSFVTAPTGVTWSAGYTSVSADGNQGTGGTGVFSSVAYKTPAGTAVEQPSATWANACDERYLLVITLTLAAGGQTVAVGTAAETDTGRPIAAAKARALGAAVESDTARPLTAAKARTVGLATSTETAMPVRAAKARAVGPALESDGAQPIAAAKRRAVGTAVEVDVALSLQGADAAAPGRFASTTAVAGMSSYTAGGDV